jgi:phenylpyruvate tautomerase PptA (4-oxalocrotonate tautomerase family)
MTREKLTKEEKNFLIKDILKVLVKTDECPLDDNEVKILKGIIKKIK